MFCLLLINKFIQLFIRCCWYFSLVAVVRLCTALSLSLSGGFFVVVYVVWGGENTHNMIVRWRCLTWIYDAPNMVCVWSVPWFCLSFFSDLFGFEDGWWAFSVAKPQLSITDTAFCCCCCCLFRNRKERINWQLRTCTQRVPSILSALKTFFVLSPNDRPGSFNAKALWGPKLLSHMMIKRKRAPPFRQPASQHPYIMQNKLWARNRNDRSPRRQSRPQSTTDGHNATHREFRANINRAWKEINK